MPFVLPFASTAPVTIATGRADCLGSCGGGEGEGGDSVNGNGEAQRTGRLLLPPSLLLLPLPSASLVSGGASSVRAIPDSKLLYGLLDLLALVEAARAMALRFLDMPMRFIMSFSMAGMRIERSLWSFLLAADFCVERGRKDECGVHR